MSQSDFVAIMREVYRMRRAGVSSAVSLMAVIETDEQWDMIVDHLTSGLRLIRALEKRKPRNG